MEPEPSSLETEEPREGERGQAQRMSPRQFWGMLGVGVVVLLVVIGLACPMIMRSTKASERTMAIFNAKQVGLALLEFDQEFGRLPSDATVADVVKATGAKLDYTGGSSNAMFRQLIAYGIQSEYLFYSRHPEGAREPDNVIVGRNALEAREVGFSYVAGLDTDMDPGIPVLMTPMRTASRDEFWMDEEYGGKAVVLRLDYSAEAPRIRPSDDKVVDKDGVSILAAAQPYFSGKRPDIRHPKMKP